MKARCLLAASAVIVVASMGLPLASLATTAPAPARQQARADTLGPDGISPGLEGLSERELRGELRRLDREIARAERAERRGTPLAEARDGRRRKRGNGFAVAGLVCALAAVLIGPLASIPGIIFGAIALRRASRYPDLYGKRKMAIAALVIGIVGLAAYLAILSATVVGF